MSLCVNYSSHMVDAAQSETFIIWLGGLRDLRARARIQARIDRLALGNPGDVKPAGEGISEMRIDHGPSDRVYYLQRAAVLIVLLCGGDKRTQNKDIATAKILATDWK